MNLRLKFIYIFLVFILSTPSVYSQTTIAGLVCDYSNDSALIDCKVTLVKNNKSEYTDSLGYFTSELKCDCIDSIIIEKDGYCTLIVKDIDPNFINNNNLFIIYLHKKTKSIMTFHDLLKKKFLGITYKHIYLTEFHELSSCCLLKDTTYYNGYSNFKTEDSLNYRKFKCEYITTFSEILKKVQVYYNNHPDSIYFPEYNLYAHTTHIYDTISPCYVYNGQKIHNPGFPGGDKECSLYIKKEIKKLNIKHEAKIIVQFIVEPGIRNFSNFKIMGVPDSDTEKVVEIIRQGPQWTPSSSSQRPRRIKKEIVVDMID